MDSLSSQSNHRQTRLFGSLRMRILLLAVLTCVFLAIAAVGFLNFLRTDRSATLNSAQRHLAIVAGNLAFSYSAELANTVPLQLIPAAPHPGPPPPAGAAEQAPPPPPPGPPQRTPEDLELSSLTSQYLRAEAGIEGGFYAGAADQLLGYSFPTHEGPGPLREMPQRELPTVQRLARDAVHTGRIQTFRFIGPHDAVLFVTVPVRDATSNTVTGAVWLMQRMPGIIRGPSRERLFGSIGFGTAALFTAATALFVIVAVRNGVGSVLGRLAELETSLDAPTASSASSRPQLDEFRRMLDGVERLAASLRATIANERDLEATIRHKERLSALGQFAAGIAHELRNPLATIRLRTQMSARSMSAEVIARNAGVVLEEVDRLDTIIERLLYFSRPIQLQLQPVSLDALCCAAANTWRERLGAGSPLLITHGAMPDVTVPCDRSRMLQVLDNLVENALSATATASPDGSGLVTIQGSEAGPWASIEVQDSGPGFSPEVLHHALDPFFTTKETGTGLGLSISFEIIQAHGGELRLSNGAQGGGRVAVLLPLATEPGKEERQLG